VSRNAFCETVANREADFATVAANRLDFAHHPPPRSLPLRVLLVHGLGRSPLSLAILAADLRRAGHRVEQLGYLATLQSYASIRERVHQRLLALARSGAPYAAVGHSMGGLVLRAALARVPQPAPLPARLIMLGTPNHSPRLARRLRGLWPYRMFNGECGDLLAQPEFFSELAPPPVPCTIVAGTAGPRGRWSPFGDEPNDGIVAVDEARLDGAAVTVELPVRHTFMMNDPAVRSLVRQLLDAGRL
jgi:pimeloyl-ACP methyl ester carboxylesterase